LFPSSHQIESNAHEEGGLSSDEEEEDADSHTHHTHHAHSSNAAASHNASFRAAPSVSGGVSMAPGGRGDGQYAKKAPAQATGQEFIIQLATTRKMLLSVLEKHDAVPDKVGLLHPIVNSAFID
jgi:hypothetical protein